MPGYTSQSSTLKGTFIKILAGGYILGQLTGYNICGENLTINNLIDTSGIEVSNNAIVYGDINLFGDLSMACGNIEHLNNIYFCNNTALLSDVSTNNPNLLTLSGDFHVLGDASFDEHVDICGILTLTASNLGIIRGPPTIIIDPHPYENSGGTVLIEGDLIVNGSQTFINSQTIEVSDNIIQMNVLPPYVTYGGIQVNDLNGTNIGYFVHDLCNNTWDTSGANLITADLSVNGNIDVTGNIDMSCGSITDVSNIVFCSNGNIDLACGTLDDVSNIVFCNNAQFINNSSANQTMTLSLLNLDLSSSFINLSGGLDICGNLFVGCSAEFLQEVSGREIRATYNLHSDRRADLSQVFINSVFKIQGNTFFHNGFDNTFNDKGVGFACRFVGGEVDENPQLTIKRIHDNPGILNDDYPRMRIDNTEIGLVVDSSGDDIPLILDLTVDLSCNKIQDVSSIDFCNDTTIISDISNTLTISGSLYITDDLSVNGSTNLQDVSLVNLSVSNLLDASSIEVSNNLFVNGNIGLSGDLNMACGAIYDVSNIIFCNNAQFINNSSANQTMTQSLLNQDLSSSFINLSGGLDICGNLFVGCSAEFLQEVSGREIRATYNLYSDRRADLSQVFINSVFKIQGNTFFHNGFDNTFNDKGVGFACRFVGGEVDENPQLTIKRIHDNPGILNDDYPRMRIDNTEIGLVVDSSGDDIPLILDLTVDLSCNKIQDVSSIYFCNDTAILSDTSNTMTISGNLNVTQDLNVNGTTNLQDVSLVNLSVANILDASSIEVSNNLFVNGDIGLSGDLNMACGAIDDVSNIIFCNNAQFINNSSANQTMTQSLLNLDLSSSFINLSGGLDICGNLFVGCSAEFLQEVSAVSVFASRITAQNVLTGVNTSNFADVFINRQLKVQSNTFFHNGEDGVLNSEDVLNDTGVGFACTFSSGEVNEDPQLTIKRIYDTQPYPRMRIDNTEIGLVIDSSENQPLILDLPVDLSNNKIYDISYTQFNDKINITSNNPNSSISIGVSGGLVNQGVNAIAIGNNAGNINQGKNSIAIGYAAGSNDLCNNTIMINASDSSLNTSPSDISNALFIKPIRKVTAFTYTENTMYYNETTHEVTYNTSPSGPTGNIFDPEPTIGRASVAIPLITSDQFTYNPSLSPGRQYNIGVSGRYSFLPGGNWSRSSNNHIPQQCDSFIFLKTEIDISALGLGISDTAGFIPCYFRR